MKPKRLVYKSKRYSIIFHAKNEQTPGEFALTRGGVCVFKSLYLKPVLEEMNLRLHIHERVDSIISIVFFVVVYITAFIFIWEMGR